MTDTAELDRLVAAARDADGLARITYRDPIAAHGADGIAAVEPWVADPRLGAFAVRVIERAGGRARPEAVAALRRHRGHAGSAAIARDIDESLARMGARVARTSGSAPARPPAGRRSPSR